ncbi:MAG TPA: hypothetical protein VGB53_16925 [Rubricoccaceae bacterium]|jgi:hypothetical protein
MTLQRAWETFLLIAPLAVSIVFPWIALSQAKKAQKTAEEALRQANEARADPLRHAAFLDMKEGMQACYEAVVRLMAGRDRYRHSQLTEGVKSAHTEGAAGLETLEILRRKWAPVIPPDFENELVKFSMVFKNWQIAIRPLHSEYYTHRLGEFETATEESRSKLDKMVREATRADYLLGSAKRTLNG